MRLPQEPASRLVALVVAFALSRVLLLVLTRSPGLYPFQDDPLEISVLARWGAAFADGGAGAPLRDGPWEYPAGAAVVVVAPALLPGAPYVVGFVGQMLLWDLAALLVLALLGLRRGTLAGAWLWVAVVPLLGPVALARFDVIPTALAVAGLAVASAAPVLAGGLLAGGAVVKLWPALLLLLLLLHRGRARVLAGSVTVGLTTLAAVQAYGGTGQLLSFLTYQRDRGLEVESLPALPLMLARAYGDERMVVGFGFGSYQVDGPWAPVMLAVGTVGLAAVLAAGAALAWRARRADPELAVPVVAVALMAGVLVFDKVLSAQYPLWLAGLVALSLCRPDSPLRPTVAPLLGLLVLTQAVYPLAIQTLTTTTEPRPVLLLAARDLLLVVVAGLATRAAWRLGSPQRPGPPQRVGSAPGSEQRVGADEHGGKHRHRDGADHEHQLVQAPPLGQAGQRPDGREEHEVDPREGQQRSTGPHEHQRQRDAGPGVEPVRRSGP